MTARKPLPPSLADRPFAVHEALTDRVGRRRLGARDLESPFHGVRAPAGSIDDLYSVCAALATRFRDGDAFVGPTAARLWGMPVPAHLEYGPLHVGSRLPLHPMRRRGVHGTLHDGGRMVVSGGLPLLAPADAWVDLAPYVDLDGLVAAGDWTVTPTRERPELLGIEEFMAEVQAIHRRRGIVDARRALALVRVGAWSPPESHLRLLLGRAGLPEPVLNVSIAPGLTPDLSWPGFRVAVEYNGEYHERPEQERHDLRRAEGFGLRSWTTVNVDRRDLYRAPLSVVTRVASRLRSRGWTGDVIWPKTHS